MNTHIKLLLAAGVILCAAIWGYGLSIEVPAASVSQEETHDSSQSRFDWRSDNTLQAEVAFLQNGKYPFLVDKKNFAKEVTKAPGSQLEFLALSKIPHHPHYDEDFAERLGLGLIMRPSRDPVLVKPKPRQPPCFVEKKLD